MLKAKQTLIGHLTDKGKVKGKLSNPILNHYPDLENLEITPSGEEQKFNHPDSYGYDEITVKAVESEELKITPSITEQVKEGLYKKVTVDGDENLVAENIVKGKSIFGVEGVVNASNAKENKVFFVDYDGTILYSYTLEEIQNLNELPPLPEREGLICQEWNWDLDEIKEFNQALKVGASYITDDGKTRVFIELISEEKLEMNVSFKQSIQKGTEIDWGDGSPIETSNVIGDGDRDYATLYHTYSKTGKYIITLNPLDDCRLTLGSNNSSFHLVGTTGTNNYYTLSSVKKIHIGKNVSFISSHCFGKYQSLTELTIPSGITEIKDQAFSYCYSLKNIVIPKGLKILGSQAFYYCYSLQNIMLPSGINEIGSSVFQDCNSLQEIIIKSEYAAMSSSVFSRCSSLRRVHLPTTTVDVIKTAFFMYCYSLEEIIIPQNVTTISSNFCYECRSLKKIILPSNLQTMEHSIIQNCKSLSEIIIPNTVNSMANNIFYECENLKEIILPEKVTILNNQLFYGCDMLMKVICLGDITQIGTQVFSSNYSLMIVDFSNNTQVPVLSNTNAFNGVQKTCKIIVPDNLYDEWIVATNWSTYAKYIVKASEVSV